MTLNNWGLAEAQRGNAAQAVRLAEEALGRARALGEKLTIALALHTLGELARQHGRLDHALAYCDEGLRCAREVGDMEHITTVLMTLHALAEARGDARVAEDLRRELTNIYTARLQLRRQHGDRQGIAETVFALGRLARYEHNEDGALTYLEESVTLFHTLEMAPHVAGCLEELACVAVARDGWARAAHLFGVAQGIRERWEAPLAPADASHYLTVLEPAWMALGETQVADILARGHAAPWTAIVREALGI